MEGDHGAEAVKNRYPNGVPAAFLQSAFPEVYLDCAPAQRLLFRASVATSAPHSPTKRVLAPKRALADSGREIFERSMNGRQFIYHMQGLTKTYPPAKKVLDDIHLSFYPD